MTNLSLQKYQQLNHEIIIDLKTNYLRTSGKCFILGQLVCIEILISSCYGFILQLRIDARHLVLDMSSCLFLYIDQCNKYVLI